MTGAKENRRTTRLINELKRDNNRLWDALSWLEGYDPGTIQDLEGEFQFSVHDRTVQARILPRSVSGTLI